MRNVAKKGRGRILWFARPLNLLLLIVIIALVSVTSILYLMPAGTANDNVRRNQKQPAEKESRDSSFLLDLTRTSVDDYDRFNDTLSNILVKRVSGTAGNVKVRRYIERYLRSLGWTVELDDFTDRTPYGNIAFSNIIATHNPDACKRVVLSCHFDSKYFAEFEFLGAIDSAVPCAMILELVRILHDRLNAAKNNELTLQLMFFDGEEAFKQWTDTDSLYGSRNLAAKLENTPVSARVESSCPALRSATSTELDRIDVLILLDLIGARNPQFCPFFDSTRSLFNRLKTIERKLNKLGVIESNGSGSSSGPTRYFSACKPYQMYGGGVDDDHKPFLQRGVSPLHLIAAPFPPQWHRESDNGANLHHPTINNLMKIFRVFFVETLNLN